QPGQRQRGAGPAQRAVPADGVPVGPVAAAVDAARLAGRHGAGVAGLSPRPARAEGGRPRRGTTGMAAPAGAGGGDRGVLRAGTAAPGRGRLIVADARHAMIAAMAVADAGREIAPWQ